MTRISSQNGNALFMVLFAIALFAALTFVLTQQRDTGAALSSERIRLLAGEVIDMGSKMADTVAQLRLKRVPLENISFQNDIVDHYDNLNCTSETCRVFGYTGGARDWETPAPEISNSVDWGYTGDISIDEIGTDEPELVALLPNVSLPICERINRMLGIGSGAPPQFVSMVATKFVGNFASVPFHLSNTAINGKKSGCVLLTGYTGNIFTTTADAYAYYQVLVER